MSPAIPGLTAGADLLMLDGGAPAELAQSEGARAVLRRLIGYHLRDRPLNTRRILADLRAL
jgi:hypothetical protein